MSSTKKCCVERLFVFFSVCLLISSLTLVLLVTPLQVASEELSGFHAKREHEGVPLEFYDLLYTNLPLASTFFGVLTSYSTDARSTNQIGAFTMKPYNTFSAQSTDFNAGIVVQVDPLRVTPNLRVNVPTGAPAVTEGCPFANANEAVFYVQQLLETSMIPNSFLSNHPKDGMRYNLSVLVPPSPSHHNHNNNAGSSSYLCTDCMMMAVLEYNKMMHCHVSSSNNLETNIAPSGNVVACINAVFFLEREAYRCEPVNFQQLSQTIQTNYGFTMQPLNESSVEWKQLTFAAEFNEDKFQNSYTNLYPLYVVEWAPQLPYVIQATSASAVTNRSISSIASTRPTFCFAKSTLSVGMWLPFGGWIQWGRVGVYPGLPSQRQALDTTTRTTTATATAAVSSASFPPRHVVLLAPSTSISSVGGAYSHVPGADSTVSGVVAALAVAETVKRAKNKGALKEDVVLDLVFLPAEWLEGVGSKSLFHMLQQQEAPQNDEGSSASPSSFFVDRLPRGIETADMVIALDQLANRDAPLYYHVDERIQRREGNSENPALDAAVALLRSCGVRPATTTELPASPISRYIDFFPEQVSSSALLTIARYDNVLLNPHAFTPSDHPSLSSCISPEPVTEAANAVLRLVTGDLLASVSGDLVHRLWNCLTEDWNCSLMHLSTAQNEALAIATPLLVSGIPQYPTKTFHPEPSAAENGLRQLMKTIGMEKVETLPALPPPLSVTSEKATCWQFTSDPVNSDNAKNGTPTASFVDIYGEVVFASSAGARLAMVNGEASETNWVVFLVSVFSGVVVIYYTLKLVW